MTVFIDTNRFSPEPQYGNSATTELAYSTDSTSELLGWALLGLVGIFRDGYRYRKAGDAEPARAGRRAVEAAVR